MKLAIVFVSMCIGIAAAHAQTDSQDYDFWIYEGCAPPGPILEGTLNGTQYFFGRDTAGNTRFLASAGGLAVERVEYGDFGMPILLDGNGQPLQGSGSGNTYLFHGRRYDPETGFYFDEHTGRSYDPLAGRYLNRGPVGDVGNAYTAAADNPWSPGALAESVTAGAARRLNILDFVCFASDCVQPRFAEWGQVISSLGDAPKPTHPKDIVCAECAELSIGADMTMLDRPWPTHPNDVAPRRVLADNFGFDDRFWRTSEAGEDDNGGDNGGDNGSDGGGGKTKQQCENEWKAKCEEEEEKNPSLDCKPSCDDPSSTTGGCASVCTCECTPKSGVSGGAGDVIVVVGAGG